MDHGELFEAARTGNVEVLREFLKKNPQILTDIAITYSKETLLHVATKAGQLNFVREIIKHKPEFATELSEDGVRPVDIAAAVGNAEMVKELLDLDHEICRLKGKDGKTALHYAAMKGRVNVIEMLVSSCSRSILEDVTVYGQTALHLAVMNNQFKAFSTFVKWLESHSMKPLINWVDRDGNTILHLAASRKQLETIEVLLGEHNAFNGILDVNATNSKGLTAMDVLDMVTESPSELQFRRILQHAGAVNANLTVTEDNRILLHESPSGPMKDWFKYFKFQPQRDSPSDTRNVLLVVAALIASVTFQAGVNPPTGLLQNKSESNSPSPPTSPPPPAAYHPGMTAGLVGLFAISGVEAGTYLFLFGNTLGLTASLSIIIYLTAGFPFQRELLISVYSLMFTYGCIIGSTKSKDASTFVLLTIAFTLPFLLRWLPRWGKKLWKWWRWSPASLSRWTILPA